MTSWWTADGNISQPLTHKIYIHSFSWIKESLDGEKQVIHVLLKHCLTFSNDLFAPTQGNFHQDPRIVYCPQTDRQMKRFQLYLILCQIEFPNPGMTPKLLLIFLLLINMYTKAKKAGLKHTGHILLQEAVDLITGTMDRSCWEMMRGQTRGT